MSESRSEHRNGSRTVVIGLGNTLRGDDGVGVIVARHLAQKDLPAGIEVIEGAMAGLDLLWSLQENQRLILVDAARMGAEPGEVRVLSGQELGAVSGVRFSSTHGFGVSEVLTLARSLGIEAEVTVVGIEPYDTNLREGLSESVARRLPEYVELTRRLAAPHCEPLAGRARSQRSDSRGEDTGR